MTINAAEASRALDEIDDATGRTLRQKGYREAAPYFMLWGVVWIIGNGSMDMAPQLARWLWPFLIVIGVTCSIALGMRQAAAVKGEGPREAAERRRSGVQIMLFIFLVFGLVLAASVIFWPVEYREINAFISMCTGFAYVGAGILTGWRLIALGAAVIGAVLAGHLLLEQYYYVWMAAVGGGSLLLGGLWLRTS